MTLTDRFPCHGLITFLPTDDLDAVSHFYETVLGLPLVRDQGRCRIFQTAREAYVAFCEGNGAPIPDTYRVVLTLLIDDVDGAYDALVTQGVQPEDRPSASEAFAIYRFFVRDPHGYLVEIQRFDEPLFNREP